MHKKLGLALGFVTLFVINAYLIGIYYRGFLVKQNQVMLLDEIAHIDDARGSQFALSAAPLVLGEMTTEVTTSDARASNLRDFFRKYNSPLFPYADIIVRESDKNSLDYRLLPGIAMQESGLCRVIPDNSYNCWGWGITGSSTLRFQSYEQAIETVAAGIKKGYVDKGLTTASEIMRKYTPSSNGSWQQGVNHFMGLLE